MYKILFSSMMYSEGLNEGETPQLPPTPSSDEEKNEEEDNDASHNHKSEGTDMNVSIHFG